MPAVRSGPRRAARTGGRRRLLTGGLLALTAIAALPAQAQAITNVDLSNYVRVGRYDLPEPTRTTAPANNLLGQEASAVTYNPDTDSLFITGDGGTSITQVSKTGALIDTMTLAQGSSPQGTEFYDTEGITYIGGGKFVMTEERYRQLVRFTYAPGTTLTRNDTKTVKLGTTIDNIGLEGVTDDPSTGDFIPVKETSPVGIFQTGIDWDAGTATNGSPTTVNSTNLFDPALAGLADFADVFALSNVTTLTGPQSSNLLILSQESGRIVNISRTGVVSSSLTINPDLDTTISVQDQTHEGLTMDNDGNLYVVSENGGGDINHPQLWVYAPATAPNQAPTAVALVNRTSAVQENTSTATRLKVADVRIGDDGLGTNNLAVTGPDASAFEVDGTGLYLKAGVTLDYEAKTSYQVAVTADDPNVGGTPDATSTTLTLNVTDVANEGPSGVSLIVSEVAPWGSGNGTYAADWFEITNTGSSTVNLSGYKMDDNSNTFGSAVALNGVSSLAPGESAVFIEGTDSVATSFKSAWFGGAPPAGYKMGTYSGSGVGLSTGGDAVNVFDGTGTRITGVSFGSSTDKVSFDNAAGSGSATLPLPTISTLSVAGKYGAFTAGPETGSPGTIVEAAITEVSPWSSGNSPYAGDWFEVTNKGLQPLVLTGWKMDDNSNAFGNAVALGGVTTIAPGASAVFIEGDATVASNFVSFYGPALPAGVQVGTYGGSGVGLSTGGDAVNVFDNYGSRVTGVQFGAATAYFSLDNAAAAGSKTLPLPTISTLSADGVRGATVVGQETTSPGSLVNACDKPGAIHLGSGDNVYTGTVADEVICGDGGNDTIRGGGGRDRIFGGEGNDKLFDGTGSASVHGNEGDDTITTDKGDDRTAGGTGRDVVSYQTRTKPVTALLGGTGNSGVAGEKDLIASDVENLRGGTASDQLIGDDRANEINGWGGGDTITANGGDDVLLGTTGADSLNGGSGADTVYGSDGADTLVDGTGADLLFGGPGADALTITVDGLRDTASCGADADTVNAPGEAKDKANADCETVA